jgi:hypothetical protein
VILPMTGSVKKTSKPGVPWPILIPSLSQTSAARLLAINQPKISALVNHRPEGFSVERLMRFLNALDREVEIVIRKKPRSKRTARIVVTGAQLAHTPSVLVEGKWQNVMTVRPLIVVRISDRINECQVQCCGTRGDPSTQVAPTFGSCISRRIAPGHSSMTLLRYTSSFPYSN